MEVEMGMKVPGSTEFKLGGVVGNEDGIAGDPPGAGLGVLRGKWPCTDGDVNPLHRHQRERL